MFAAVEREQAAFAAEDGLDVGRPRPDALDVADRITRVVLLEFRAFEAVAQVELAAIGVIGVDDVNERLASVGQAGEELALYVIELAAGNFIHAALAIETVGEEL